VIPLQHGLLKTVQLPAHNPAPTGQPVGTVWLVVRTPQ
jgi:hypothetical protein